MAVPEFCSITSANVMPESVLPFPMHKSGFTLTRSQEKILHCLTPFSGRHRGKSPVDRAGEEGDASRYPHRRYPMSRAGLAQGLSAPREQQH